MIAAIHSYRHARAKSQMPTPLPLGKAEAGGWDGVTAFLVPCYERRRSVNGKPAMGSHPLPATADAVVLEHVNQVAN